MAKSAIITGINGQDGAYLANKLLNKKIKVYGIIRRGSSPKIQRLKYLKIDKKINFIHCEITEHQTIANYIKKIKPDFIFNLAAQSFVQYSFNNPNYTFKVNLDAVLNMLETLRRNNFKKCRFYQASTSEMYGNYSKKTKKALSLNTPFKPCSPYAISKVAAHDLVKLYRESYGLLASSGILFNHESPLRGNEFVTKKIVKNLVNQKFNNGPILSLGNLSSTRDWGHANDFAEAIFKIASYKAPRDFVIATGKSYSVRYFFLNVAKKLGFKPKFRGKGLKEICIDQNSGKKILKIDKKYFRENELFHLKGDPLEAKKKLNWRPSYNLNKMIYEMIDFEKKHLF
jgi:GDPmannose 4,6-dehydratase